MVFYGQYCEATVIYERHLIKSLLSHLAITTGAIICIVWLSQTMKLAFVIELGTSSLSFFALTISAIPTILVAIFPLAIAVSYFGKYSFLSSDRELIALSSAGLSSISIAKPAMKLTLILTLIGYIFSFYIGPISYHFLKNNLSNFRSNYVNDVIHEHSFNQISKNITVYVDNKDSSNLMSGIIIFDNRNAKEPAIIFANKGALILDNNVPAFALYDGMRQVIDKYGDMNQMSFSDFTISLPSNYTERSLNSLDLQEYTINQLISPNKDLSEKRLGQIIIEKHQRMIWPGYIFAFASLTLGIFLKKPYSRIASYKPMIKVILSLTIVLYIHFSLHNLAARNHVFILLSYANLFATIFTGYIMLKRQ
jgi:lipopolysaccharide export system permease protein